MKGRGFIKHIYKMEELLTAKQIKAMTRIGADWNGDVVMIKGESYIVDSIKKVLIKISNNKDGINND